MNHIEFVPFHNRHIRFRVNNGPIVSGAVFDSSKYREGGRHSTIYTFVPTGNMIEFKKAEEAGDLDKAKSLKSSVDILEITWAENIFH